MTGTGILKAFDFSGKELWMRDIQKEYGRFGLNWGYGSSPMLLGDSLFVQVLHGMKTDDPSYILRISKANGRTIWRQERPTIAQRESPDSYTTPAIVRHGNDLELVITGGDAVTGHDVNTGKELWRADVLNPTNDLAYRIVASPVVHGELIIAPTRERPMVVMRPGGRGDVAKSHVMWEFQNGPDVPTPVTDGTYVYVVNDRGIMWCLDAKTGKEIYGKQRLRPSTYSGSFTMADGKLYITNEDGLTTVAAHGAEVRDSRRERLRRLLAQLAGGLGRADLHSHHRCAVGNRKAQIRIGRLEDWKIDRLRNHEGTKEPIDERQSTRRYRGDRRRSSSLPQRRVCASEVGAPVLPSCPRARIKSGKLTIRNLPRCPELGPIFWCLRRRALSH